MRGKPQGKKVEQGLALVSVLWALSILSLMAASMVSMSTLSYRMERNALNQVQGEAIAEAGITLAILALSDSRPEMRWRVDGATQNATFSRTPLRISIQAASGLIDLNEAGAPLLGGLLRSAGVTADQAATLVAQIVAWRTPGGLHGGDDTSAAAYAAAGHDYRPRGGAFQSVDELKLILGMTPELFVRIAPALTVYSHQPTIDMQVAPKEALLALPDLNADQVEALIASRISNAGATVLRNGQSFAIRSELTLAGRLVVKEAVVRLMADPNYPYVVLLWR